MKKTFSKACLFTVASAFLFENAGFLTHQLNLAFGIAFLVALGVSYLPMRRKPASVPLLLIGIALLALALAAMPGEYLRPGALALFLLGLYLVLQAFDRPAPELPLFSMVAAGYGLFFFLYRSDVYFWRLADGASFGFSRLVADITQWLPGPKAQLGPSFLGLGTVVVFALLFVIGGFFLTENRVRKVARALCSMAVLLAVYVLLFTYLPRALDFQLKVGPVPSEAEQSRLQQAQQAGRPLQTRTESEQATRVIFSADSLADGGCPLWAPILLVGLFLIPAYFFFKNSDLEVLPLIPVASKWAAITGAAGLVLLLVLAYIETEPLRVHPHPNAEPQDCTPLQQVIKEKRVAFYYHGFANWMRPSFRQYGSRSSGMFGNLPDFVEAMGFNQPLPGVNEQQAQYLRQRGSTVETQADDGSGTSALVARDELGYLNSGVLLNEITEESLRDVDILMLLNIDDRLNSQNPPAPLKPSARMAARQAVIAKCSAVRDRLQQLLDAGDYTDLDTAKLAGLAAQPLPQLAELQQKINTYTQTLARFEDNKDQAGQLELVRQNLAQAQDTQVAMLAASKSIEPLMREITELTDAKPATLQKLKADVIAVIDKQMNEPQQKTVELIRQFVARGGALLVIGDHTFLKASDQPDGTPRPNLWLNEVLEPFDIKFINDSAEFFIGGWLHSMEPPLHALTCGLQDDYNSVGMVVGASLKVTGTARPVIIGKYGYLDAGDMRDTRGYLGNLDFDMGERLGDAVIAAEQSYGKGKVLVFGDTSAFANGIITNTGGFVNRVFAWLAAESGPAPLSQMPVGDVRPSSGWLKTAIVAVLLIGGIMALVVSRSPIPVVAAMLAIGAFVSLHSGVQAVPLSSGQNKDIHVAYVDHYHMPQISKEGWRPNGTMGLHLNLMRNGFYSQNLDKFDLQTLRGADVVVSLSPTRPFSPQDVETIRSYLSGGGTLILTAGHEDLPCIQPLLNAFELRIPNTPLGRFRVAVDKAGGQNAPFWRVWPIESTATEQPLSGEKLLGPMETLIRYEPLSSRSIVYAEVDNQLQVRPPEDQRPEQNSTDQAIADELQAKLLADPQLNGWISAKIGNGIINLIGNAPSTEVEEKAKKLAETVTGCKGITSRVKITSGYTPHLARTDEALAAELKAKIEADAALAGQPIQVSFANGKCTLSGSVFTRDDRQKAAALAATVACQTQSYSLAVRRPYGNGQFILIGDSGFWMNKNLEIEKLSELSKLEQEQYHDGIQFMKWLLETYVLRTKESK